SSLPAQPAVSRIDGRRLGGRSPRGAADVFAAEPTPRVLAAACSVLPRARCHDPRLPRAGGGGEGLVLPATERSRAHRATSWRHDEGAAPRRAVHGALRALTGGLSQPGIGTHHWTRVPRSAQRSS